MTTEKERRNTPRVELCWPVTLFIDDEIIEGESQNINSEGLYICCDKPLPIDGIFRISIQPPNHRAIGVTGKVVWSDLYGMGEKEKIYGMGLCLVKLQEGERKSLEALIAAYL